MEHGLLLAAILFVLGLVGVLTRRNLVFILMSLEIMLNATGLAFIVAASRWGQVDGQIMFLMIHQSGRCGSRRCIGSGIAAFQSSAKHWISTYLSEMKG